MATNEKKDGEIPVFKQQKRSKVWLVLLAILGACIFSLCAAGSGLRLWRTQFSQTKPEEAALSRGQQEQTQSPALPTTTPSPTPTPTPVTPTSVPTIPVTPTQSDAISLPQAEPAAAVVCPEIAPIDEPVNQAPAISPISFATRQGDDGWPVDPALQFTPAISGVVATFGYTGMRNGLEWERVWRFNDELLLRGEGIWDAGPGGKLTVQAVLEEGQFAPGLYTLEIYVAGQLLGDGAFSVVEEDTPRRRPVQVAYTTWDGETHRLNLLDLATNQTEVLLEAARSPAWSVDAEGLLYYAENGNPDEPPGLRVFNMEQGQSYPLEADISTQSIAWSAHRPYVASTRNEGEGARLVLWDIHQNRAFDGPAGADPAWSPEGLRLAYRNCDEEGWHISTIQVISSSFDIGSIRHLTSGDDSQPAWSWDGQRIAFVRRENGNQDIYSIRTDGSGLIRLTDHPASDLSPAWTPDHRLIFRSLRDGQWGLYIMNADGSGQRKLVGADSLPEWQPDAVAVSTDLLLVEPSPPRPQIQVPAGHGLLAVSNQANNDEMTFTINNVEHKIGPYQVRTLPLPPGHYTWTASWPGKHSRTGIADIVLGQVAYPVVER